MKKKTLITIVTIIVALFFSISYSFAANEVGDAVEGIRNFVGGAENVLEDTASGIGNGIRDGISATENTADNITSGAMTTDNNNGGGDYTATRTTATTRSAGDNGSFLGMGATAWGWLIMAIVGIITVALVWYYGKEHEYNSNNNDGNY